MVYCLRMEKNYTIFEERKAILIRKVMTEEEGTEPRQNQGIDNT